MAKKQMKHRPPSRFWDSSYFDMGQYFFVNSELHEKIVLRAKMEKVPKYIIFDRALKQYIRSQGIEFPLEPKIRPDPLISSGQVAE